MDAAYLQKIVKGLPEHVEVRVKAKEDGSEVVERVLISDESTESCERCGERVEPNTMLLCGGSCDGS